MTETSKYVSGTSVRLLGISLVLATFTVVYLLFSLWPEEIKEQPDTNAKTEVTWKKESSLIFGQKISLIDDQRIIVLVLLAGLLGSFVHTANSFSTYVGANQFEKSWIWWYMLRPFVGMSIALIFYLVFRGGLFAGDTAAQDLNIYGILTMAALTGLFSDRATLKLEEVFENLFKPKDERDGKLQRNDNKDFDTDADG